MEPLKNIVKKLSPTKTLALIIVILTVIISFYCCRYEGAWWTRTLYVYEPIDPNQKGIRDTPADNYLVQGALRQYNEHIASVIEANNGVLPPLTTDEGLVARGVMSQDLTSATQIGELSLALEDLGYLDFDGNLTPKGRAFSMTKDEIFKDYEENANVFGISHKPVSEEYKIAKKAGLLDPLPEDRGPDKIAGGGLFRSITFAFGNALIAIFIIKLIALIWGSFLDVIRSFSNAVRGR